MSHVVMSMEYLYALNLQVNLDLHILRDLIRIYGLGKSSATNLWHNSCLDLDLKINSEGLFTFNKTETLSELLIQKRQTINLMK